MSDEIKENIQDSGAWMRLLFMLLFGLFFCLAKFVVFAVIIFQLLHTLLTGRQNKPALSLGAQLSSYIYQIFRYLTYNSDERPFPFDDWPSEKPLFEAAPARKTTQRRPRKSRAKPATETTAKDDAKG